MADTNLPQTPTTPVEPPKTEGEDVTTSVQNDLEELISTATNNNSPASAKIEFGASDTQQIREQKQEALSRLKRIPKRIAVFGFLLFLCGSFGAISFLFYQYLGYQETGTTDPMWSSYMPTMESYYTQIMGLLHLEDTKKYDNQSFASPTGTGLIQRLLADPGLDFLAKRKVMHIGVVKLMQETSKKYTDYATLKKEVGQQGFFPKDLQAIAKGVFFNNSLQKAIISIESVRFTTALKFFSVLDSFLSQLSSYAGVPKDVLSDQLNGFLDRGEKDINNYITSCYLNGYEVSASCSTIGDFANYYQYLDKSRSSNQQRLFIQTMDRLESKLENADFPSLEITMKSIDPINNTISISVDVNTFKEDEVALTANKGIINPHIYLVTSLINHLRESRYVITDSINITSLQVASKKIKIGSQTVPVDSSSFSFQLPLQSDVQREIYDFVDITKN